MKKKKGFDPAVARYFNPQKSGTNIVIDEKGRILKWGTHQMELMATRSFVPVFQKMCTAIKKKDKKGNVYYHSLNNYRK